MSVCFENERVEAMAISLEEQLSIAYPDGPSFFRLANSGPGNEEGNGEQIEDARFRASVEQVIDGLAYQSDIDEFKKAMAIVVHRWKAKNSNDKNSTTAEGNKIPAGAKKSLSLFDQLQGGFALPVTFDQIEEASSTEERLKVFQKIEYLEDLLMDWNKISPLLRMDLSQSFVTNLTHSLELIDLHRKWFHKGRSSSEYTPLLFGICENLLQTLVNVISSAETNVLANDPEASLNTIVISLVQDWKDMWLDLMQRDQYSEELAGDMEKQMLELFVGPPGCKVSTLARKELALVDPSAKWFHSWTYQVQTHDHLISLLRDAKALPELWTQMQTFRNIFERTLDDTLSELHSTAIVSIVLCRSRLSHFPWDSLINPNLPKDSETTVIDEMLELFLNTINFLSNADKNESDLTLTILDGIETILAGSQSEADRRHQKVITILQEQTVTRNNAARRFLNMQLNLKR